MKVTELTRARLARRREERDMLRDGWEYVGEGGGKLWELYRGARLDCIITETKIAVGGKAVWVRVIKEEDFYKRPLGT